jgi:hypothetical protein
MKTNKQVAIKLALMALLTAACSSGCTLVMAFVPSERICFGEAASLRFHAARRGRELDLQTTKWMLSHYPQNIRTWLGDKGAPEKLTINEFWTLYAVDLWAMGYRKCDPDTRPDSQEEKERRANDWKEWQKTNEPPDPNQVPIPMTIIKSTKIGTGG